MNTLQKFYDFVSEISASNSRKYKEEILVKYKDDDDIKRYLKFVYDPFLVTGISSKKIKKETSFINTTASIYDVFDYVLKNNTGRDVDISFVNSVKNALPYSALKTFFELVITKNLQLGIESTTINKIIPNLISEFSVQLANKYYDDPTVLFDKQICITTKIDGGRIILLKQNGEVKFYTRQGQEYLGLVDLEKEALDLLPDNTCFDGEITVLDSTGLLSKDQYKKAMKITRADGEKHGVKMKVFDYMPAEDFLKQNCDIEYINRRNFLTDLFYYQNKKFTYFELLPLLYCGPYRSEYVENILNEQVDNGEEGIMINTLHGKYEFKRGNTLLKVKKYKDIDLRIIGFEEGKNKLSGTLGAFLVSYKGFTVKVGSGLSDVLRNTIWNNKDEWLGKIISIKYFEETENADGGKSLRFPVYIDVREDKTTPDA